MHLMAVIVVVKQCSWNSNDGIARIIIADCVVVITTTSDVTHALKRLRHAGIIKYSLQVERSAP